MPISMDPGCHYVLSKSWGRSVGRLLTDRTISKYQKMGYYSNGIAIRVEAARQERTRKRLTNLEIFGKFL